MAGQKKLVVDEAIIPAKAVFDYSVTESMSLNLTIDGAMGYAIMIGGTNGAHLTSFSLVEVAAMDGLVA